MNCEYCGTRLVITSVYFAGTQCKTQVGNCQKCLRTFTLLSVMVCESERGKGAYALAEKIKKGQVKVERQSGRTIVRVIDRPES